jgi:nitrite reductase/ring-hydroxylating ferredoxin subunit
MVGSVPIAVFNLAGRLHALEDCCVRCGSSLSAGQVEGTTVRCPRCHWPYDVTSGSVTTIPAIRLDTFPVRVVGAHAMVETGVA